MSLPKVMPYEMPRANELTPNRVAWEPSAQRAILLIHDMQEYFLSPFLSATDLLDELIGNIAVLKRCCVQANIPVCFSTQPGGQSKIERGLLADFWGPGLPDDPRLCQITAALSPAKTDTIVRKRRYSAFCKTDLLDFMQRQGRDQLIICGVYAHIGCLATAMDAFMNGVQPLMAIDALGDFSAEDHAMSLNYSVRRCAVAFSTKYLIRSLS